MDDSYSFCYICGYNGSTTFATDEGSNVTSLFYCYFKFNGLIVCLSYASSYHLIGDRIALSC